MFAIPLLEKTRHLPRILSKDLGEEINSIHECMELGCCLIVNTATAAKQKAAPACVFREAVELWTY